MTRPASSSLVLPSSSSSFFLPPPPLFSFFLLLPPLTPPYSSSFLLRRVMNLTRISNFLGVRGGGFKRKIFKSHTNDFQIAYKIPVSQIAYKTKIGKCQSPRVHTNDFQIAYKNASILDRIQKSQYPRSHTKSGRDDLVQNEHRKRQSPRAHTKS